VIRTRIDASASTELTEAVRWYEHKRAGLGAEFFEAVAAGIELIRARPEIGAPRGRTRSWLIPRFPFRLVYRVRDNELYVVAVAHTSRRPGYWRHRGA